MKLIVKDFTNKHSKEAFNLCRLVNNLLPQWIKEVMIPIEIWNHPTDVYGLETVQNMKAKIPHYDPDLSGGGYCNGRIIIYLNTFKQSIKMKPTSCKKMSVLGLVIHELGHYLWEEVFVKRKLFSLEGWNQVRGKDGQEKNILSNKFNFLERYGFFHEITAEEDFSESLRYFVLHTIDLWKEFTNRYYFFNSIKPYLNN